MSQDHTDLRDCAQLFSPPNVKGSENGSTGSKNGPACHLPSRLALYREFFWPPGKSLAVKFIGGGMDIQYAREQVKKYARV